MEHVQSFTAASATNPLAPYTAKTFTAAEAAYRAADATSRQAMRTRIDVAHRISGATPGQVLDWTTLRDNPEVHSAIEAERGAQIALQDAETVLVLTDAPDWRSWAIKFQVAREHCDDLLNPLDLRDRKAKYERGFRGSKLAADLLLYAVSAHSGLLKREAVEQIPTLVSRLVEKRLGFNPETHDVLPNAPGARKDIAGHGLVALYRDAVRLAQECAASPLHAILEESDRLTSESAGLCDKTQAVERAALDEAAAKLHNQFIEAPITSQADAIAKLRWIYRGYAAGHTEREPYVLRQFMAWFGADPQQVLSGDKYYDLLDTDEAARVQHDTPQLMAAE